MSDLAICVENCILSHRDAARSRAEGLSKPYHIGRGQQRHDTTSTRLRTGLRDALTAVFRRQASLTPDPRPLAPDDTDLWALRDVSFAACPECNRRAQRGEVVGIPATELRTGIGRNGAGKTTLLKILFRITEPTSGQGDARRDAVRHARTGVII
jgi:lipopolysaccharide transport system ATP-binding protein